MLTVGFIILIIAGIVGLLGFGLISSPVVGPARVGFYFLLVLSLVILIYGTVQQGAYVEQDVPTQEQE
jgi:uncharacterized membrane protein YtjA (UPF0391 family)